MPPRKGIVKSGNAGNSKASSERPSAPINPEDKPLFPAGSKYPLSLLHERCQKNDWKANVETRNQGNGWAFTVTISRTNPSTSERDTVRMTPHPAYILPTAIESKHWGATYALYRFCNGIQLNRVLPEGPRDYWAQLSTEHKNAPAHLAWMYAADPFAASKEVAERQAKVVKRTEAAEAPKTMVPQRSGPAIGEFALQPEAKMSLDLREMVENVVKKAATKYPALDEIASTDTIKPQTSDDLVRLGFKLPQAREAIAFLSAGSAYAYNLLSSLTPLEAAIEYLVLHLPEVDLPERFLPTNNSSKSFVSSAHAGTQDIKRRWVEDKAVKEAGFPALLVKECTDDPSLVENWEALIIVLGRKLIGIDSPSPDDNWTSFVIDEDEVEAMGAEYVDHSQIIMTLFSAPVKLHILVPTSSNVSTPGMYITSAECPAYIRLHLLATLLTAIRNNTFKEQGEGFLVAAMRLLEGSWADIEDHGPPDITDVMKHILPAPEDLAVKNTASSKSQPMRRTKTRGSHRTDDRDDDTIRREFHILCETAKYRDILAGRQKLPAFTAKDEFLSQLKKHRVVVVVGETGWCVPNPSYEDLTVKRHIAGKQLSFILDSLIEDGGASKAQILITQPRRISAISVAARVASERMDDGSVGHAIRGESKQNHRTKLLFCTTGVVLRRLGSGDKLTDITHVVVDEVHERSVDGDFLLLELKQLLASHPTLKVVLMSATINHETFVKYYNDAPLLEIPGYTHPVTDMYLEDIIPIIRYRPSAVKRGKPTGIVTNPEDLSGHGLDEQTLTAIQTITRSDRIDYQLIAAVVTHIANVGKVKAGILIFLPGVQEIRQCLDAIKSSGAPGIDLLPLHANLSNEEQRRVFVPATNKWKVIAATNVAETSITIDDVIYVVDAGKVKETQFDPENGLSMLVETWVTRAAARQRRGRAGRTQPGFVYKLYTRKQEQQMAKFPTPEILRVPLESISLTVKVMREHEDVKLFLAKAISPPKLASMEAAWVTLQDLGAIDQDGRLTALGRHMSSMPVDLRLSKMMILGTIFQCLDPVATIAAMLSSKPLFTSPMERREDASRARARFSTANSDLLTDLKAFDACVQLRKSGKSHGAVRDFCEENFISSNTFRDIQMLRSDFLTSLSDLGFIPSSVSADSDRLNANKDNNNLIKAVILGGLWPRVARVHLPTSAIKFDKVQAGTVQRANTAKEYKMYDLREGRVFLHPASVLFEEATWKSPFLVYFNKHMTSKVFLRDATEVPLYALLLFGGPVTVNHVAGGLTIGTNDARIKLKAYPRIGILVNQLRRLLDAQLQRCIEDGTMLCDSATEDDLVLRAMLALLIGDGLTPMM